MNQSQPYPPSPYQPAAASSAYARPPRAVPRNRRVFFWIFIGLQALMLLFTITSTAGDDASSACMADSSCASASETAQGNDLLQAAEFWAAADVIVFTSWAAWKLSAR